MKRCLPKRILSLVIKALTQRLLRLLGRSRSAPIAHISFCASCCSSQLARHVSKACTTRGWMCPNLPPPFTQLASLSHLAQQVIVQSECMLVFACGVPLITCAALQGAQSFCRTTLTFCVSQFAALNAGWQLMIHPGSREVGKRHWLSLSGSLGSNKVEH